MKVSSPHSYLVSNPRLFLFAFMLFTRHKPAAVYKLHSNAEDT